MQSMSVSVRTPMEDALNAIASGTGDNPFAVLGPHRVVVDGRFALVVRTMQPSASDVQLVTPARVFGMQRRKPDGIFEATIPLDGPADEFVYWFRVREGSEVRDVGDPYRFGPVLSDYDLHLFAEGTHYRAWQRFGAHRMTIGHETGVHFAVWAPNAQRVSVIGDFNRWDGRTHVMRKLIPSGVWEIFIPDLADGMPYKYEVRTHVGHLLQKADPYARRFEVPPNSASVIWSDGGHRWSDSDWIQDRESFGGWHDRPMSIYEVHLGAWRRVPEEGYRSLTYRELATTMVPYVREMGYTHIELMPVLEHPFTGSWGYQVIGFFAPTSRFGTPDDFRHFVDECHRHGLGVILDWVPGHFPKDEHGLAHFDGTALYEHADPRQGEHREWGTLVFNYGRNEVRSFLFSSALFWLEEFHLDGLRVDAVASMLYLDYSRNEGEWIPNQFGGRENLEAVSFLRRLNADVYAAHPDVQTFAEESTAWPMVSRPTDVGGLGFGLKWDMGWMHDTLQHLQRDPIHRAYHHDEITFRQVYANSENFVLPLSHDEVVHGKGSLLGKMLGDDWQRFANLRLLLGSQWAQAGKKLLFMGGELAQPTEWDHDASVAWWLEDDPRHAGVLRWVRDLNDLLRREPALHAFDTDPRGFEWIDAADPETLCFLRRGPDEADVVVVALNMTPTPHERFRLGLPGGGTWHEALNSDAQPYGGSGMGNLGRVRAEPRPWHGRDHSAQIVLPPLACVFLRPGAS